MTKNFSAPGKMVVAGEYAVLYGHEALSISVNRRVNVVIKSAPALPQVSGVVESVLDELRSRGLRLSGFDANIDSSALQFSNPMGATKLGLGSSAAVCVALVRALLDFYKEDSRNTLEIAFAAHDRFTQGLGSGIDVATSFYGGAIKFKFSHTVRTVIPCSLTLSPDSLLAVYTNSTQSTTSFLKHITSLATMRRRDFGDAISGISQAAQTIVKCMTDTKANPLPWKELCEAVLAHNQATKALGRVADIDIMSPAHQAIAQIAERHGGAAKPSGAGGGDLALCFVEPQVRGQLIEELEANSFSVLDLHFCDAGVQ